MINHAINYISDKAATARQRLSFLQSAGARRIFGYALKLILGAMFGAAKIFGGYAPFGLGYIAAAGSGAGGLAALFGVTLGAISAGGFAWAAKYTAAGALIFAALTVFRSVPAAQRRWFPPLIVSLVSAIFGVVYLPDTHFTLSGTAYYICEVILAGGAAYFYKAALAPKASEFQAENPERRRVSLLIFMSTLCVALSKIEIFETLAVGRIASVIVIMLSAYKGGLPWGAISGVAFGAVMDAASYQTLGGEPFFAACYALTGLVAGIFAKTGKLPFILTYIIVNAVSAFWNWTSPMREPVLYETFAASVIFFVLPNGVLTKYKERVLSYDTGLIRKITGLSAAARYTREKAAHAGAAFSEVHELLKTNLGGETNDNDISSVFDVAADSVCRKCRRSSVCWSANYEDTKNILNDVTAVMQLKGGVSPDDFAPRFSERCENLQSFIAAINGELKAVLLRRMYRAKLRDSRDAVYSQFDDMSSVLYGIADSVSAPAFDRPLTAERNVNLWLAGVGLDLTASAFCDANQRVHLDISGDDLSALRHTDDWLDKISAAAGVLLTLSERNSADVLELAECEPLSASIGIASLRKRGEDISGDNGTFFKTDDGMLHVILSDGMGSGDPAARDSAAAVRILERFLKAGVRAETALKILGSVMTIRNEDSIGCATIDLLCLNLFNGEGKLYKYGAAPSYIRRGNAVRRVSGDSLSAGLARNDPECTKLWLEPGSFAVIVSDGVAGPDDDWLSAYLAGYSYTGSDLPKELAREVLEAAIERAGDNTAPDDMTSLVLAVNC